MAVAVLVLGIVVMHHVARPEHDGSGGPGSSAMVDSPTAAVGHAEGADVSAASDSGVADGDAPSAGHGLLHLCLAVLTAAAVLVVGWLLLARRPWLPMSSFVAFRARPKPSRAPPRPHGSALLMSLCVIRT
ncbi:hypothetical protein E1262_11225 [Jiangella aurantiaca]|uniref:Uncharacterized protein n=2 Tax=Jiangella aurantiaca TaxID=2530373 RepID=A0A4R5AG92_9ACTN|nr:hypothetical protein E1262_11225 [Jiangella aurantiaca]